ncbi:VanZ family protein [Methylobacterium durans]|uniref:VanZ family protein n=1 Tax=Methylobacterium durans TaxID=2202825 RepID=UPI002AFE6C4B|nr:VanZ family protein [Methylobacterium durans]MEA1834268.1 VanZ family protein [Methylobacterium durans]
MSAVARALSWLMLAALVVVTVAPIGYRPVSAAPISVERCGAFALLGFLFAFGYPRWRWQVFVLTLAAAGLLEILQMLQPTRHGRVADFAVKAAGCGLGGLAALALAYWPGASAPPDGRG